LKNHSSNKYPVLKHLDLSGNKFFEIPKTILFLNNLRTLYISYNQIRSIDDVWAKGNLPRLEVLDASNNALTDLSDEVYFKAGLNFLNIENNSLTKLPTVLGFMRLSALKVDGNPLKLIKRAVIDKGTVALMEFLRTKHMGEIPHPIEAPI
jgi:Leucine-rich repeat (LRR) protein